MSIDFNRLNQAFGGRLTPDMKKQLEKLDKLGDDKAIKAQIQKICPGLPEGMCDMFNDRVGAHLRGRVCVISKNDTQALSALAKDLIKQTGNSSLVNASMRALSPIYNSLTPEARKAFLSVCNSPDAQAALKRAVADDVELNTDPKFKELEKKIKDDTNAAGKLSTENKKLENDIASILKEIKVEESKGKRADAKKIAKLKKERDEKQAQLDANNKRLAVVNERIKTNTASADAIRPNCVESYLNTLTDIAKAIKANPSQASDIKDLAVAAFQSVGGLPSTKGVKNALMALDSSFPTMAEKLPASSTPFALAGYKANMSYLFDKYFPTNTLAAGISKQLDGVAEKYSALNTYANETIPNAVLATNNGAAQDQNAYTNLLGGTLITQRDTIRSQLSGMQEIAVSPSFYINNDGTFQTVARTLRTTAGQTDPIASEFVIRLKQNSDKKFGNESIVGLEQQALSDLGTKALQLARNSNFNDQPVYGKLEIMDKMTSDTMPDYVKFALAAELKNGKSLAQVVSDVVLNGPDHATMLSYQTTLSRDKNTAKKDPSGYTSYRDGTFTPDPTKPLAAVTQLQLASAFDQMRNSDEFAARIGAPAPNGVNPDLASNQPELLIAALGEKLLGRPLDSFETEAWMQAFGNNEMNAQGQPIGLGRLLQLAYKSPEVVVRTFLQNTPLESDTGFYQSLVAQMHNGLSAADAFSYVQQHLA